MTQMAHLTEEERQSAADGTLAPERMRAVYAHLAACATCAADVARLQSVVRRSRSAPTPASIEPDSWPGIRERIEQSKVIRLKARDATSMATGARRPWIAIASTAIAAVLLVAAFAEMQRWRPGATAAGAADTTAVAFASVVDSSAMFETESKRLLEELEMQRAMMPPSAAAAFDDDLRVIDRSIAELQAALARDPHNLALRRLLAASYREKVELLERANNAG